jgi:hypothetical protein
VVGGGDTVRVRSKIMKLGSSLMRFLRHSDSLLSHATCALGVYTKRDDDRYHCTSSTRRFFARPSSASLDAIGE